MAFHRSGRNALSSSLSRRRRRAWAFATLLSALSPLPAAASPREAASPPAANKPAAKPIAFDIAPQALTSAVEAYAAASGVQVIYDRPPDPAVGSPGVRGAFTPEAALRLLLANTGLTARFTDPRDAVLSPLAAAQPNSDADPGAPPPELPRLALDPLTVKGAFVVEAKARSGWDPRLYGRLIQASLQQALAADPRTASGDYTAELDLRVGPGGEIQQVRIAGSSGQVRRDAAILAVVSGVVMESPPPPELGQPIRVALRSRRHR